MPSAKDKKQSNHSRQESSLKSEVSRSSVSLLSKPKFRKVFMAVIIVLVFFGLGFLIKNYFLAATVNGKIITRYDVARELEKQGGKQTLDNLVVRSLIYQEANKNKITVSADTISQEVKKIEDMLKAQGMTLDQALQAQNINKKDLEDQIKIQKLVEAILSDKLSVSSDEAMTYFEQNKSSYPAGTKFEDQQSSIVDQLKQQKLSTEFQTWITDIKSKAKLLYFFKY